MNILYGLAGEGYGHSSRALVIADYLKKKGHKVIIVSYGQAYKVLKGKFRIFKVYGAHLIFKKGKLSKTKTLSFNITHLSKNLLKSKKIYRLMKEFKPDLCISDMELIVPMLSNWYELPLICIDNQHRITNLELKIPKKYYKDFALAREIVKLFVRSADFYIVTSFSPAKTKKRNTFIVPPIIRDGIRKLKPRKGNKILVYLTKQDESVLEVLKNIKERFVVYGYDKKEKQQNLEFKKRATFLRDLASCKAIIATSGFTLISEALYLKKPYLALPLLGQFEQILNALYLKQAGFGDYSERLDEKEVVLFLHKLQEYEKNLKRYRINDKTLFYVLNKVLARCNSKKASKPSTLRPRLLQRLLTSQLVYSLL